MKKDQTRDEKLLQAPTKINIKKTTCQRQTDKSEK